MGLARGGADGKTSPEELIAAAHSACFSMALSHALAQAGTPAEQLDTTATVTFVPGEGITKIALSVRGTVPGIDEAGFVEAAEGAKVGCPVSKALAGVPEITLDAASAGERLQPLSRVWTSVLPPSRAISSHSGS